MNYFLFLKIIKTKDGVIRCYLFLFSSVVGYLYVLYLSSELFPLSTAEMSYPLSKTYYTLLHSSTLVAIATHLPPYLKFSFSNTTRFPFYYFLLIFCFGFCFFYKKKKQISSVFTLKTRFLNF